MSFCGNCGSQLDAGQKFCPNCGSKTVSLEKPASPPAPQQGGAYGAGQNAPQQFPPPPVYGGGQQSPGYGGAPQSPPPYQPPYGGGGAPQPRSEGIREMFLTYHGRLNRKPYILRGLLVGITSSILSNVMGVMAESSSLALNLVSLVLLVVVLALCVVSVMLMIRRWHDLGKSGWFSLLLLVPLVNLVVGLYLWVKKGDDGPNRYGEDPLAYRG
ncbi:hypothetical protein HMPREF9081_0437 [Centipeda periodontii DSM 2778]|jgi:hypothetical protein|uniref:Zinc-ribbon domain-containing protein n=1 Tax=Centipeda periodontii DSM 2778 TaxID=888060 RepID=F5RJK2_9FIRM|nr:DUF805 domain-containing protein [Centipeda periodontii]EGK61653.1 hypothetical protein HMPREF9081_0437 [Centipeda periodontii DSM 2778]